MRTILTALTLCALATAAAAQTKAALGPGLSEVPLPKANRDGSILQNGVRFFFGSQPKGVRELGPESVVEPRDGPDGEIDYPGAQYCARSAVLGLTALAVKAREAGGDTAVQVRSDPAHPNASPKTAIICENGRVVLHGVIVVTP